LPGFIVSFRIISASAVLMALFSCAGVRPEGLGVKSRRLAACPSSPNCVSSDDAGAHGVAPFQLAAAPADAWSMARAAVTALPRSKIITQTDDYLHVECSSAIFGFVDDLELHLRPQENAIAVRSAARLGYSDIGVNRRRVENLRNEVRRRGAIR
jgi:uncharacterized protein (DUF1499 family)